MAFCANCRTARAVIVRPKNKARLCKSCFLSTFEAEIHETIVSTSLFRRGEKVAIGASGGKDSTVLASVLGTLNRRHDYGLDLVLLSIDEGIKGYRDDSLETVKRNAQQYQMPLRILGYADLYGWTMDEVVEQIGKKGNCTYCGVFRRQALDRGAAMLGVQHVVTGHNADDMAETVMMNLLRGDLPRLSRSTSIVTSSASPIPPTASSQPGSSSIIPPHSSSSLPSEQSHSVPSITSIKRSKPLKYAYEKEIVLYAHHKNLDYFSTECIYSPEAFRGSARTLIKNLERIRPSAILDIIRSGEELATLVPSSSNTNDSSNVGANAHNVAAAENLNDSSTLMGTERGDMKEQRTIEQVRNPKRCCMGGENGGCGKKRETDDVDLQQAGKSTRLTQVRGPLGGEVSECGDDDGSLGCGDAMAQTIDVPGVQGGNEDTETAQITHLTVGQTSETPFASADLETEVTLESLQLGKSGSSTSLASSTQEHLQDSHGAVTTHTSGSGGGSSLSSFPPSSHSFFSTNKLAGSNGVKVTRCRQDGMVPKKGGATHKGQQSTQTGKQVRAQTIRHCARCGYMSSQLVCKACTLIESLNKAKAARIVVSSNEQE